METAQKVAGSEDGASEVNALAESEKVELAKAVADSQESASEYDLTRLANTVEGYAPKPNYIVKSALNMELIWCPPGSFIMGPGSGRESPAHPVILTQGFYLGKYEVTQKEYKKVMGNNPSRYKEENFPVDMINWENALSFCEALNKKDRPPKGLLFALPTEAQWEYACRAGTSSEFSWGTKVDPFNTGFAKNGLNRIIEVGTFRPNQWGFYDMHGNVVEWINDWFGAYSKGINIDPNGPKVGTQKVTRGGSWNPTGKIIPSALRGVLPIDRRTSGVGFRLCLAPSR